MKKIIRLTERDLTRIVKRVINETNRIDEGSPFDRIEYFSEIRQAKSEAKESDKCMCVARTRSGVVVDECTNLTETEQDGVFYRTKNCPDNRSDMFSDSLDIFN